MYINFQAGSYIVSCKYRNIPGNTQVNDMSQVSGIFQSPFQARVGMRERKERETFYNLDIYVRNFEISTQTLTT